MSVASFRFGFCFPLTSSFIQGCCLHSSIQLLQQNAVKTAAHIQNIKSRLALNAA